MRPVKSFTVKASLPKSLEPLHDLAYNLYWTWNTNAVKLFYRVDRELWEEKYHNPVSLFGAVSQERFEKLAGEEGFQSELKRIRGDYENYLEGSSWYSRTHKNANGFQIAYFSLEFGLIESVPIYSGGLGILAGDHLKSASDLGLPLVGVGLLYQEGYFKQYLNNDGWQGETYVDNDFYNMPVTPVRDSSGQDLHIELEFPDGVLKVRVWKIAVGRVPLILLDTNLPENPAHYRKITASLYGGDKEMRLQQEMLLGVGGLRALYAMDIWPSVFHMNEGHAAFLAIENIRSAMEVNGMTFDEASELTSAGSVFTTHTPVPAGHDRFSPDLVLKYFRNVIPELGMTDEEFLALGRIDPKNASEEFCMTILALKSADHSNAVSRLHMHVSRDMWRELWPGFPEDDVPIQHVTNGVHVPSWVSQDLVELFDRYVGPRWKNEPTSPEIWNRVLDIPDEEIWRTHERRRERLVTFARRRLQTQLKRRGVSDSEMNIVRGALNSKALTIGFARRFATYKRAGLIFSDIARLAKILTDPEKPVQIIIAGKAHPQDNEGKKIIRQIIHYTRRPDLRNHIVFIEDYDICVARYLVQGVDVWLNNPRRPLEASGTSGMKAAANGALNFSILDGWWDEAYTPDVGWAIGHGEMYDDPQYQDAVESNALYDVLEKDLVPLYYDMGVDGLPRRWIHKMKTAMSRLLPAFNTDRMVHQYFHEHYLPANERYLRLRENEAERSKNLALWKQKIRKNWQSVKFLSVETVVTEAYEVGGSVPVTAVLSLGDLSTGDVAVELYAGRIDSDGSLVDTVPLPMEFIESNNGGHVFRGTLPFNQSGRYGYDVRVMPSNEDLANKQELMLITWASGNVS